MESGERELSSLRWKLILQQSLKQGYNQPGQYGAPPNPQYGSHGGPAYGGQNYGGNQVSCENALSHT